MREVVIAGVGLHPFGRFDGKSIEQMGQEALIAALRDANDMDWRDVQFAFCATMQGGTAAGHRVISGIGLTGIPIVNLETACASGGSAIQLAAQSIATGMCDVVAVLGVEKMPRGFMDMSSYAPYQRLGGYALNPVFFGLWMQRRMEDYGDTLLHLAKVSHKNHKYGVHNPYAMYRKEMTVEEILNSPMVCYPLTLLMLCAPNEGAAALILCAKEVAHRYTERPITIAAAASGVAQYGSDWYGAAASFQGDSVKIANVPVTTVVAREAYEKAGIGPEDIDVAEVQDGDAGAELIATEQLLFFEPGQAARMVDEKRTEIGGDVAINTSGGLLSKGEPVGASALHMVAWITWQLRGQLGTTQVPNAKTGLTHVLGAGGNCAITILRR